MTLNIYLHRSSGTSSTLEQLLSMAESLTKQRVRRLGSIVAFEMACLQANGDTCWCGSGEGAEKRATQTLISVTVVSRAHTSLFDQSLRPIQIKRLTIYISYTPAFNSDQPVLPASSTPHMRDGYRSNKRIVSCIVIILTLRVGIETQEQAPL